MRTASQEGHDHATLLRSVGGIAPAIVVMISLAVLPGLPAAAQGVVPCTAIENDAERLACYDRALRPTPAPAAQGQASSAAQGQAAPAATEVAPRQERRVRESAAPAAPAAPVAASSSANDDGIIPIVIVGVRSLPGREAIFTAEDGTTWVQTDSSQINGLPDTPFEAELKSGAMGSRFLLPRNHPRAIRVRPSR